MIIFMISESMRICEILKYMKESGKNMISQQLTPNQYRRTNNRMYIIMMLCYLFFIGVEYSNMTKGANSNAVVRIGIYVIVMLAITVVRKFLNDKKAAMVIMALSYLCTYPALCFANGAGSLAFAFPVLVGFMMYLNSRVVLLGCVSTFIICAVKSYVLKAGGDLLSYGFANVVTIGLVISIFASYWAITLLIRFDKENREEIEKEAKHRQEVAQVVVDIVEKLDDDFQQCMTELDNISGYMGSAHDTMDSMAGSSEDTAQAVSRQADMTSQIQHRLEGTNEVATEALNTTEEVKEVVENGMKLADELQKQSVLVDENTARISKTVEMLVENVQKVSGITESILAISSQTNLLALNASIEAARAGEAGRGFAVVADQIRNLAEETKTSTEQITQIINELTAITNDTQAGIEESVESIHVQRKKVEEVNTSFTQVEGGMNNLEGAVVHISNEVKEVLDANSTIVESIEMLSSASEEVSAGTQSSKEVIDQSFDSLNMFCMVFQEAFTELERLKASAER